jgi:hypothetical protein
VKKAFVLNQSLTLTLQKKYAPRKREGTPGNAPIRPCVSSHRQRIGSHFHLDERKDLPLFGQPSLHTTVERHLPA